MGVPSKIIGHLVLMDGKRDGDDGMSTWFENTTDFGKRVFGMEEMFEHLRRNYAIKGSIGDGDGFSVPKNVYVVRGVVVARAFEVDPYVCLDFEQMCVRLFAATKIQHSSAHVIPVLQYPLKNLPPHKKAVVEDRERMHGEREIPHED